jgi:hypothetical protein
VTGSAVPFGEAHTTGPYPVSRGPNGIQHVLQCAAVPPGRPCGSVRLTRPSGLVLTLVSFTLLPYAYKDLQGQRP